MSSDELAKNPAQYIGAITITKNRDLIFSNDFDEEYVDNFSNIVTSIKDDDVVKIPIGGKDDDGSIWHGYTYAHKNSDYFISAVEELIKIDRFIIKTKDN